MANGANPAESVSDTELWSAVAALPAGQRTAVVYHYVAGLPYAEIAALTDTTVTATRRRAADGIANLRKHYPGGTPS